MARETVKTYDDVLDSVRAFNKGLVTVRLAVPGEIRVLRVCGWTQS